jgi:hypothetical protein
MFASTHVLLALPLPPGPALPAVLRDNETPLTVTVVEALTVSVPAAVFVRLTEQEPVPPAVRQLGALRSPVPLTTANVIVVPFGAGTNPDPLPSLTSTWPVS